MRQDMKRKNIAYTHYLPKVDYKDTKRSWFTHDGTAYSVVEAPSHVFSAAVLARYPKWKYSDGHMAVLKQDDIGYHERWWLLCCLADNKHGLALYGSREQAERVCAEQMVAG
jgi:hypothetical protein